MRKFIQSFLGLLLMLPIIGFGQTCPTYSQRNNGNGGGNSDCGSETGLPSGYSKTGSFQFSGTYSNMTLTRVDKYNSVSSTWEVYQNNSSSPVVVGQYWYGGYNGTNNKVCFYVNGGGNGVPPAANWKFYFGGYPSGCAYSIDANGVLPLTWETVTAEKINGQSLLKWSTASEQNTKDFEVQYSTNTNTWEALGTVPAAGNSSTTRNYSYTHQNPLKGNNYNYYRILQRDLDGKFSYSKIVSVLFGEPGSDVMLYPNPADDVVTVFLAEAQEITLLNAAGTVVFRSKLPAGRSTLAFEKYSPGVYILRTNSKSLRFVIQ